jgi:hypothetical protein
MKQILLLALKPLSSKAVYLFYVFWNKILQVFP